MTAPIRRADPQDAAPLAALSIEVWLSTYVKLGVTPAFATYALETFTPAAFLRQMQNPDVSILVADGHEGLIGYAQINRNSPAPVGTANIEVCKLYVQPRHHGQGVGQTLMRAVLGLCQTDKRPWLMVSAENPRALAFYHAQGFERVAETMFRLNADEAYPNQILAHPRPGPDRD